MTFHDAEPEEGDGMSEDWRQRVENGKRMRRAKDMFREALCWAARGLTALSSCDGLGRWVGMLLRDVGPAHYLDWRAREHAHGWEWQRDATWVANRDVGEELQDFEPVLFELYRESKVTASISMMESR